MATLRCPDYMVPVSRLASMPVRMTSDLTPKPEDDGKKKSDDSQKEQESQEFKQKTSPHFPGCTAWIAHVECVVGTQTIDMPDGTTGKGIEMKPYSVTIWATADEVAAIRAAGRAGAWVRLEGLMAGAFKGNAYLQATGLKAAKEGAK
ncbi:hypothetical protein [Corynebacterium guaraldiae]|uniref:hypothetical protein n=1 Tax=Corynebacterium guaraldiae TaxID=3051103 RepID=UPI0012B9DA95|nr:hypothetical protein [Corynebacterium guaraldiae]MTD98649.1 hypothetical protein [Corynebacterium guaraldiae]